MIMMKKFTLIIAAVFMMSFVSQAQHIFEKGDIAINAGLGLGSYGGYFPSIEGSVEFGVIPTGDVGLVSFGGLVAYKYSKYTYDYWYYNESYNYHQFAFGGRAAWHLHTFDSDQWDVYAGLGLGMHIYSDYDYDWDAEHGYTSQKVAKSTVYEEVFVGGRMMFDSGFGLFAEVGYSAFSSIRAGLTFKL